MADASNAKLDPAQQGMTPIKVIQTYSADDWEAFIEEWAEGFDPPYKQIVRIGGAGDMGRDIIGHLAHLKKHASGKSRRSIRFIETCELP